MHSPYLIIVARKNGEAPLTTEKIKDMLPDADTMYEDCKKDVVDYITECNSDEWPVKLSEYFSDEFREGLLKPFDEEKNTFAPAGDSELQKKHLSDRLKKATGQYYEMIQENHAPSFIAYVMRSAMNDQTGPRVYLDGKDLTFEEFLEETMDRQYFKDNVYYQLIGVYDYHF